MARGALCAVNRGNVNGVRLAADPPGRERPPLCPVMHLPMTFSPTDIIGKLPKDI